MKNAYIVTSTTAGTGLGNNRWTKFRIEECSAVNKETLIQGKEPEKLPNTGDIIAEQVFTDSEIGEKHYLYDIIRDNLIINANSYGNYMYFDVTEYIRKKLDDESTQMSFRLRLVPDGEQDYSFAINNALPKLLVEYEALPENGSEKRMFLWDSFDGIKAVSERILLK